MLSPFALRSRTALSEAKGLRVNSAKHLLYFRESEQSRFLALLGMTGERAWNDSEGAQDYAARGPGPVTPASLAGF